MSRRVVIAISIAGVILLGLFGVGAWVLTRWVDYPLVAARSAEAEAAAKKAGLPWTSADLRPAKPIPASENAAEDLKALHLAVELVRKSAAMRGRENDYASGDAKVLARYVRDYAPVLTSAERMAAKPRLDMARDWDLGPAALFPELSSPRYAARALLARAELRMLRGDLDGALADTTRVRKLARLIASEPTLIGLLVALAMDAISFGTEQRLAAAMSKSPRQLRALERSITDFPATFDIADACRGEVVMQLATLRNLAAFGGIEAFAKPELMRQPSRQGLRTDGWPKGATDRASMVRIVEAWTGVWPELNRHKGDPMKQVAVLDDMMDRLEKGPGLSAKLAEALFPVFAQLGLAAATGQSRDGALRGLISVLRSKAATNRWPTSLKAAGFQSMDGFGRPYVLRVRGASATVYSYGSDGQDDGGLTQRQLRGVRRPGATPGAATAPRDRFDVPATFPPPPRGQQDSSR